MDILGKNNTQINFKKSDSQNKEFAFMKAHELNNIEQLIRVKCVHCNSMERASNSHIENKTLENRNRNDNKCFRCNGYGHYYTKNIWRTGKNTNEQLIVETDNPSKENIALIVNHLNNLFSYKFNVIKTLHGFHIIGEYIYPSYIDPITKKHLASVDWIHANALILNNKIQNSDEMQDIVSKIFNIDTELRPYQDCGNYKNLFTTSLKNSGLLNYIGDFDILYTVLSIKYGKSTLRISKKQENDKYEEMII